MFQALRDALSMAIFDVVMASATVDVMVAEVDELVQIGKASPGSGDV